MVRCALCTTPVWLQQDRLEAHINKVHNEKAAPRKSFTTYKARVESNHPPKQTTNLPRPTFGNIRLTSQNGQRAGKGSCGECGKQDVIVWHYDESNRGPVDICGSCKTPVFERSFGK